MKGLVLLISLLALVAAQLELATDCDETVCQLPSCRCSSINIPGGLRPRDTPQLVTVTFDDSVTIGNIDTYRDIFYPRRNSNNCPIGATFFVNHEYTNYQLVNELYNQGYEIGLRSISQRFPQTFWAEASYNDLKEEVADQIDQMAYFANIPRNNINGVRLPYLQLAGNNSFAVMKDYGLQYDASWTTTTYTNPALWPYTLDYQSSQDCPTTPCPTASIPSVWVQPLVAWRDLYGFPCSTVDGCIYAPEEEDAEGWYNFIVENFERHYLNNRAPFGFYIRESHFRESGKREAYIRFLNLLTTLPDVFLVNKSEVIEWIQNPVPINEYRNKACRTRTPVQCVPRTCQLQHNNMYYWLGICQPCPRVYPWVGNPFGV